LIKEVKEMEYAEVDISMAELRSLPSDLQLSYLVIGQISNDLGMLFKLVVRASPTDGDKDLLRVSKLTMSILFVKLAAGRLIESWKTLKKYLNKAEKDFGYLSSMDDKDSSSWRTLNRYFSNSNPIADVRNKIAFHTDADEFMDAMVAYPDEFEMKDFHFQHTGNNLFGAAELAQLAQLAAIMEMEDPSDAYNAISDHVIDQSRNMLNVCGAFILVLLKDRFPEKLENVEFLRLEYEPEHIRSPLSYFYRFGPAETD
jgi:hypothetical protein